MESAYFSETAEGKKSLRDGDDGKLALVLLVEDVQVELNPQPSRRVAVVAALNPETERAVDLRNTDGHVDAAPAVEVALVGAGLDGGEQRVFDVHRKLGEARRALADVDLASELQGGSEDDEEVRWDGSVPRQREGRGGYRCWC